MWAEVSFLEDFYSRPLGRLVRLIVGKKIKAYWPDYKGLTLAGLGYSLPFLEPFAQNAKHCLHFMPFQQGGKVRPNRTREQDGRYKGNLSCLIDDSHIPLADMSIDRLLIIHRLEQGEGLRRALREYWRILNPEGRLLVIVPNRASIWARTERTPFGFGSPFSVGQVRRTLQDAQFLTQHHSRHLLFPPIESRALLKIAPSLEKLGQCCIPVVGGLIMMEAVKRLQADIEPSKALTPLQQKILGKKQQLAHKEE